ncbi:MAG TPA: 6-hydroxymethylpterin diphosphokinase MptE-like protein [Polyangiaceae bacterium]|nr:6-hydroxymethylpterin diphosphokinase MptE-like protein [Polyangiaceae bacterium]
MTAALHQESSFDYAASCLAANVIALELLEKTAALVLSATPSAKIVTLPGGVRALETNGHLLGAPSDDAQHDELLANAAKMGDGLIVVLGAGLGHGLSELRARTNARILCYEPDPGNLKTLLSSGPCDLGGIPIVTDLLDFKLYWESRAQERVEALIVRTPGYAAAYPAAERDLVLVVQDLVRNVQINENTLYLRSRIWLDDIFENLESLDDVCTFNALNGKYTGVPAFIVGAGPSLDRNAEHLRAAADKGIVIATNTSGRALARHGVRPQVLACIESIDLSADLEKLPFIDEVVRAFSISGNPRHFEAGKGPILATFESLPSFEPLVALFGDSGLAVAASVTTAAVSLAERLGCSPIVLVGQDLAFTGNQIYARGTSYDGSTMQITPDGTVRHQWSAEAQKSHGTRVGALPRSEPLLTTTAWGGSGVEPTSAGFTAVRTWLEAAADLMRRQRPDLRFVNATEGGAHVANFEDIALREVLEGMPSRGITSQRIHDDALAGQRKLQHSAVLSWAKAQGRLAQKARASAELVVKVARRGLDHLTSDRPSAVARTFDKLAEAEQVMKKRCSAQLFIEVLCMRELQQITARSALAVVEKSSRAEAEHALKTEIDIATSVAKSAAELATRFHRLSRS